MSGEASAKKIMAEEVRAILETVDRLYKRGPERYRKLIVWVNWANGKGFSNDLILSALQSLEAKERAGEPVAYFWPYCMRTLEKIVKDRQHEHYKHGDLNSVRAILQRVFAEVTEER